MDRLVVEVREHLRALLRDVLCGHLDSDLRGVADEILADPATGDGAAPEAPEPATAHEQAP